MANDTKYPVFQHYGTNAQRLAFTPSPGAGQPIYVWYETDTGSTYVYDTSWHAFGGGTGTVTHTGGALTLNELVLGAGSDDIKVVAATDGQIPIGKTADGTVTLGTITAGTGISVTNGAASITVAATNLGTVTHTGGNLTLNELVLGAGTADLKVVAATDGQVPIGKTSDGTVTLGTLTAGSGIAVTNGAAAITVAASTAVRTTGLGLTIDGGGSAITTGVKGDLYVPYTCTITANTILADQSGSIVIDIWKDTLANYPPTVADTITASAKPTLSSATNSQDSTLTGWTTSITAGDTLRFNVDSAATVTRVTLVLTVTRS